MVAETLHYPAFPCCLAVMADNCKMLFYNVLLLILFVPISLALMLLSSFTGLAYVDIMLLHPHHIGRTADGRCYIRINRKKTNVEAFIPLHPIAEQILDLYNTTDDTRPVFPLPSRDEMWFEIHELGVAIGRKENLSYHQSRHSFGTFLISEGIPIESIAKMMGHSGIKTTQRYAEVTDKKISKDMDNLMAFRRAYGTGASRERKTKDTIADREV